MSDNTWNCPLCGSPRWTNRVPVGLGASVRRCKACGTYDDSQTASGGPAAAPEQP